MSDSANPPDDSDGRRPGRLALQLAAAAAMIAALVLLRREAAALLLGFAAWVQSLGAWGPVVFVAGYVVATLALFPGWILTVAAGVIFGLVEGTLWVLVGATIGASLAFVVARHLARARVERLLEGRPRFRAVDRAVAGQGLKIVVLLRLSPLFPFNLLNYALGLTRVRFRDYLLACLAMLPGSFLYVYYGRAAGSLAEAAAGAGGQRGAGGWALLAVGLVATIAVTALVTRLARRALSEEISHA